jgi:CHAT domain
LRSAKVVISMRVPVSDVAATAFAQRFYAAIASGQSVKAAFAQGKVAVENVSISEVATPELFHAVAIKPEMMILS